MKIRNLFKKPEPENYNRFQKIIDKYQPINTAKGYFFTFFLLPFVLVFLFECLGSKSLLGGFRFLIFHPVPYLCNMLVISVSFSFALLLRRQICFIAAVAFVWFIGAFANFILLCFRVTPLTRSDLMLLSDAREIVSKYLNIFHLILIAVLIAVLVLCILIAFFQSPPAQGQIDRIRSVFIILILIMVTWLSFLIGWNTGTLENQFRELSKSFRKNGFVYCFTRSLVDVGVSKPDNYSEEAMEEILEGSETETNAPVSYRLKDPDIVIVQLESFFNINRLANTVFTENPIPNFTKYMEQCGSGHLNVPVVGAGTVNSEFEVLTGMNIDDFGAGEYPYKTILTQSTCETIPYDLAEDGYTSHVIHNNTGSFYGRNTVYPNMGFQTFTSLEYMWPEDFTPMEWAKDIMLTEEISKALDSTEKQDFVFTISVQGHGSYPGGEDVDYTKHVDIVRSDIEDEHYLNQLRYYANQLYEMDEFVGELIRTLAMRNENTILLMYGDHLPSFDFTDESFTEGTIYQTEYFIWNNMGLEFGKEDIEAYEIGSRILAALGVTRGAVNSFHQTYGQQLQNHEITQEDYLERLKELEYDILYGDKLTYGGINPYEPTQLQMGTYPISVSDVFINTAGNIIITGENFTPSSEARINDTACETFYVDSTMLLLHGAELVPGDTVTVWQKELSSTSPYIYR